MLSPQLLLVLNKICAGTPLAAVTTLGVSTQRRALLFKIQLLAPLRRDVGVNLLD